jgi:hypothetical protein
MIVKFESGLGPGPEIASISEEIDLGSSISPGMA